MEENFDEGAFLTKINNMFVKILTAVMLDKMIEVKHFMSDELYAEFTERVEELKAHSQRQMYDELNIKSSRVREVRKEGGNYVATVFLEARYMDFVLDLNSHQVVSGQDQSRIQVNYELTFVKSADARTAGIVAKCPTCGQSLEVNNSGYCKFCRNTYNQERYDWVLTGMQEV